MEVLVATETLLLVLLGLLVVGLLRSHAEILRRLEELAPGRGTTADLPAPPHRAGARPARDLAGVTPSGAAVKIAAGSGRGTLLAFLSSGCATCETLLGELSASGPPSIPQGGRLVVVTKDPSLERPARLRPLESDVSVVMSSRAWEDYDVPGSPYFAYVDAGGRIVGEGSAGAWDRVASLLGDALEDAAPDGHGRIERDLAAAGLQPGDASLYPGNGGR